MSTRLRIANGIERLLSDGDAEEHVKTSGSDADLRLQVMLLREENAMLKAERHRRVDVGMLIEDMRFVAARHGQHQPLDDAHSVLTECLLIREELERVCADVQAAIATLRTQLGELTVDIRAVARTGT